MMNIAITGMGVSGAGYQNILAFESLLYEGQVSIKRHQQFSKCSFPAAQIGALISSIDLEHDLKFSGIDEKLLSDAQNQTRRYGLVYQSAMSAMLQAWHQAGLFDKPYQPQEIAIIVAGQNLQLNEHVQAVETFLKQPDYVSPRYVQQFIDTSLMSYLSQFFNILGMGFNVSAATASGNMGIIHAIHCLDDEIKCCIVVGAMADLSAIELQALHNAGALGGAEYLDHPEQSSRPFDAAHQGFIYGQGSGCLVIEKVSSAESRQQTILARIIGAASCIDANASTQPDLSGEIRVMKKVLAQANHPLVDYINAHGTSTPMGDDIEAQAIETVFGLKPYINATKALIGHTLWPAAIIECIACVIQLKRGFLHGNINLDHPINPRLNFVGKQRVITPIQCALSSSYGFGGINTAILIKVC